MKRYNTYKSSGIERLGEIPEHWGVKRVKDSVTSPLKYGANEAAEDDNRLNPRYIRITDFSENGQLKEETFKSLPHSIAKDYLLNEDDILFARSGATVGKTFIFRNYNGKACFAGYLIKASLNKKTMIPYFLYFFSKSHSYDDWRNYINTEATIQNISAEKYNNLLLPLPPISEQTAIANYLDTKTAAIDRKIELLTAKADKYKALRRSVINGTVCRGLNLNVPLKESSIEWIGMIPKHWEVDRLKNLCHYISRGITPEYIEYSEFKVINQATFSQGKFDDENINFTTKTDKRAEAKVNDIIVASTGGGVLGKVYFIDSLTGKYYPDSHVTTIRTNSTNFNPKYLYYFLSINFDLINGIMAKGSTNQTELQRDSLLGFNWCVPPIKEQTKIVEYLDIKTTQIVTVLTNIGEQINKLTQLRKTLINDVITGQIKVTEE